MESIPEPQVNLARKILPKPLYRALTHIFKQGVEGCMLVGGTALSGFYAGHRRSDDLDFFTQNEDSQKSTILAVKSLENIGTKFLEVSTETAQYYRSTCELEGHQFTIDIVLDSNIFKVGQAVILKNNIHIADLKTMLMTKAATLVSRCSEKDLYDLIWIFQKIPDLNFAKLILLGHEIDSGVNAENILISLSGAILTEESCDFSLLPQANKITIYKDIIKFRREMIRGLKKYLQDQPAPPLKELVQRISKLKNKRHK